MGHTTRTPLKILKSIRLLHGDRMYSLYVTDSLYSEDIKKEVTSLNTILRTKNITKKFDDHMSVDHVNLSIQAGEIYGFLGPNGAGKTTLMKMMTNLVYPTSGEIELFGEPLKADSFELLRNVGSIIEYPILYGHLSAKETLELHCAYMGYKQTSFIASALELVGLAQVGHKPVHSYSLGMKQRLGLARAIVTRPKLLILDEPINGLDPVAIKEMRRIFKFLKEEFRMTLFISSHILGEIEHVADTVGIIQNGKLIEEVAIEELKSSSDSTTFHVSDAKRAAKLIHDNFKLTNVTIQNNNKLQIGDPKRNQQLLMKVLILNDIEIIEVINKHHSLEDYFIEKMKGGIA